MARVGRGREDGQSAARDRDIPVGDLSIQLPGSLGACSGRNLQVGIERRGIFDGRAGLRVERRVVSKGDLLARDGNRRKASLRLASGADLPLVDGLPDVELVMLGIERRLTA